MREEETMPLRRRDQPFSAVVDAHRPRLLACACLLTGDPARAEQLTEASLAQLYEAWPRTGDPVATAYGLLLRGAPGSMPWRSEERVQLLDAARPPQLPGLAGDLAGLDSTALRVFLLEQVAGLPTWQIAGAAGVGVERVHELALSARADLRRRNPRWADDAALAAELAEAVGPLPAGAVPAASDVAHGRLLVRRRLRRQALAAAAIAAAIALGTAQLLPAAEDPVAGGPPVDARALPSVSPPPPGQPVDCDATSPPCRAQVLQSWREQMAAVTSTYLDPKRRYFDGYAYSYTDRYQTPGFWAGGSGALGLDMFRVSRGATQVYIQIATDRQAAIRCGELTRRKCVSTRFLDGNRFLLTETTEAVEGIEVQYRPYGDQVITVVVRDVGRGRTLAVDRGSVIRLVEDKRLRLPQL